MMSCTKLNTSSQYDGIGGTCPNFFSDPLFQEAGFRSITSIYDPQVRGFWGSNGEARELKPKQRHADVVPVDATYSKRLVTPVPAVEKTGCVDHGGIRRAARTAGGACADAADRAGSALGQRPAGEERLADCPGLNTVRQSAAAH
jgi:hypothetical protein